MKNKKDLSTIDDFGVQWQAYSENSGYYAESTEILDNLLGSIIDLKAIEGANIADVGAGSGRYTHLLNKLKPQTIDAIEPSAAFQVLQKNTENLSTVQYYQATAAAMPKTDAYDFVFCIGVMQFIADPRPSLKSMGESLKKDGRFVVWVYGTENNRLYLSLVLPLRKLTSRLPHKALDLLTRCLVYPASAYAWLCQYAPLPMHHYMRNYYSKLELSNRQLVIYDQLNPKYAHYYSQQELTDLLKECGYSDIRLHHHLGYSWSASACYPSS